MKVCVLFIGSTLITSYIGAVMSVQSGPVSRWLAAESCLTDNGYLVSYSLHFEEEKLHLVRFRY